MPNFTRRWFNRHRHNWTVHLAPLADRPLSYLEIGIFEGLSASWMLDHVLKHQQSRYIGIDPWLLNRRRYPDATVVEARARANLAPYGEKATIIKGRSQDIVGCQEAIFDALDIVYIDGDHSEEGVFADSCLCWPLVKADGVLIWDDYGRSRRDGVRKAVDKFLAPMSEKYTVLFAGSQFAVRKS